jgi:hypothetical protein
MTREGYPLQPPQHHRPAGETFGPELALVDPTLAVRDAATRRICEFSDVNPPKRRRRIGLVKLSGVATLWLEVVFLALTEAHVGLS